MSFPGPSDMIGPYDKTDEHDETLDRMAGVHRDGPSEIDKVLYGDDAKPGSLMFHPERYVDETGTDDKPNPMTDVFLEFPLAMQAIAHVTQVGAVKHSSRGWQTFDPVYGKRYHEGKMGRHLLAFETQGFDNPEDGMNHPAQVAWNTLAWLENVLKMEDNEAKMDHPLVSTATVSIDPPIGTEAPQVKYKRAFWDDEKKIWMYQTARD